MIYCGECKDWYHFRCVQLSERDAEDIQLYICPTCHEKTGLRTISEYLWFRADRLHFTPPTSLEWEGPEALEEARGNLHVDPAPQQTSIAPEKVKVESEEEKIVEEPRTESEGDASEDEYLEPKRIGKRRSRRVSMHSESESGSDSPKSKKAAKGPKRLRRGSAVLKESSIHKEFSSPEPSHTKRKKSPSSQPPAKRTRSESTAGEDAARKYCLTKLQELFCGIFLRYPFLLDPEHREKSSDGDIHPDKKPEDLTDEEKERLEMNAKRFGADLEECMYELYSEPDKTGKQIVAGKYKECFRMLTFNLSKPDRVVLHMRIASSHITPKELSTMSSTDLASEETKQSIRKAEEEALAHSILKKSSVPRAKITHKGLQDIEDVTGAAQRDVEREREEEEEERIERERLARLRLQAQRAQSASQGSIPPESPVVPQTPSWGGPPPIPMHDQAASSAMGMSIGRSPLNPMFAPSASDLSGPVENELNLADLINIDEEPSPDVAMTPLDSMSTPFRESPPLLVEQHEKPTAQPSPLRVAPSQPTGLSPFAMKTSNPDMPSRPSFDLNALWTSRANDGQGHGPHESSSPPPAQEHKDPMIESDILGEEADDQDFDMFLGRDEEEKPTSTTDDSFEVQHETFDTSPKVWTGTLSMPLDSTMSQEVALSAQQMGGRTLGADSPLWQTLFPSKELRIDGRVPVETSAQYLTQMRLNASKELIAVAFAPNAGVDPTSFQSLVDYLISKGRHGLIFPWGNRPKEHAPGRELYIVPLLTTDPIPEYMELLDELRLPKSRSLNYLHPRTPTFDLSQFQQQNHNVLPSILPSSTVSSIPAVPSSASLAAEVASLTPEQIQLMLQALSSGAMAPSPPQPAQPPPPPPSIPVPTAIPLQPWMNTPPAFPTAYPPPTAYSASQTPPRPYPDTSYDRYEQDRQYPGTSYNLDRGSPYRGRGGPRGRGRGDDRPRDGGWPKGRGRGRGGPSSSPPRDRGGRWGEQPRWS
ncbi:Transcription factor bye1 [Grifola frondosa]|uniref:Transcription factor BYE1 n=1 Tax=Grifola frondosa TaxID=5627 RepID=A0A1C7M9P9_GRIFR|nr:Transcription factor bye1 [Grifola frondosa]